MLIEIKRRYYDKKNRLCMVLEVKSNQKLIREFRLI